MGRIDSYLYHILLRVWLGHWQDTQVEAERFINKGGQAVAKICYQFFLGGRLYDIFSRAIPVGETKITAVTHSLHYKKLNRYFLYYLHFLMFTAICLGGQIIFSRMGGSCPPCPPHDFCLWTSQIGKTHKVDIGMCACVGYCCLEGRQGARLCKSRSLAYMKQSHYSMVG